MILVAKSCTMFVKCLIERKTDRHPFNGLFDHNVTSFILLITIGISAEISTDLSCCNWHFCITDLGCSLEFSKETESENQAYRIFPQFVPDIPGVRWQPAAPRVLWLWSHHGRWENGCSAKWRSGPFMHTHRFNSYFPCEPVAMFVYFVNLFQERTVAYNWCRFSRIWMIVLSPANSVKALRTAWSSLLVELRCTWHGDVVDRPHNAQTTQSETVSTISWPVLIEVQW